MLRHVLFLMAFRVSASAVLADDWTGQTAAPLLPGALGSSVSYGTGALVRVPLQQECSPSNTLTPCTGGETPVYTYDDNYQTSLTSIPSSAGQAGSNLGVFLSGAYQDPTSPTGISALTGYLSLSSFARSSTVDNLAAGLAMQQQIMMAQDRIALQGIAASLAMAGGGDLNPDENFAVAGNWGTFGGQNAFAGSFTIRAADHLTFNGGMAASASGGPVGGRAGFRFAW
jgi:hypothetical protein